MCTLLVVLGKSIPNIKSHQRPNSPAEAMSSHACTLLSVLVVSSLLSGSSGFISTLTLPGSVTPTTQAPVELDRYTVRVRSA